MSNGAGNANIGRRVRIEVRHALAIFALLAILLAAPWTLFGQGRYSRYALILEDPPVAEQISSRKELRHAAAEAQLQRIEAAQATLRSELKNRGIPVTGAVQNLLNAVFVAASEDRLPELRSLPGVKGVAYLPPIKLHLNKAAELVKAPDVWQYFGGVDQAGKGLKIGIIDTGIDQNHPAFQEPLLTPPAGFPKCAGSDCAYTNNKVIVARSYVSTLAAGYSLTNDPNEIAATSRPDDLSPRDRVGHGTATAMVAAGLTNTAPNGIQITGIAPRAYLGNYKIFGSPGVNDYTFGDALIHALDDAFVDGMDVVSLSLGSPALYGPLDTGYTCSTSDPTVICDVRATAVQNAVAKGMSVVVSAGNDGDLGTKLPTLNTIATPGTAPGAITVGASTNAHVFFSSLYVTGGGVPANLQRIDAALGDGPRPNGKLTAPLKDVSTLGNDGKACLPLAPGSLTGAIALVLRGDCFFSDKVNNAYTAGAVGVIIIRDGSTDFPFPPQGLSQTAIPAAMIGGNPGQALKTFLASNPNRPGTLDPALAEVDATSDMVATFSARGPAIGTFGIKPELVAVGTDMFTATQKYDPNSGMYDPSGYGAFSGTSFSAPMVTGGVALVKQTKPGLSPAQIKSALVNTASEDVKSDDTTVARVRSVGAGKLNLAEAVQAKVAVEPATLAFGVVAGPLPLTRTLTFTDVGGGPVNLSLTWVPRDADQNAQIVLTPNTLQFGAGPSPPSQVVTVSLQGTLPLPGSYEGDIMVQGAGANFRVPYVYLVGDGVPYNIFPVLGDGFEGEVSQQIPGRFIGFKLIDQFGVPVQGTSVTFHAPAGGSIGGYDAQTDTYGIAAANAYLGPQAGEQTFTADAGGLTVSFTGTARVRPTINTDGVWNAGSLEPATTTAQHGVAPGSYIAIKGVALSPVTKVFSTLYLPLSLANVSVSFDIPTQNISLPGRIHFVSDGQVNVQIPWELEGYNSVKIKVSIGDISSAVFDLPLTRNAPAFFQLLQPNPDAGLAVAQIFQNNQYSLITRANPVHRGQVVVLYANGLGPVSNRPASGEPAKGLPLSSVADPVTVTIGGKALTPDFSGLTPTAIGLYQLQFTLPGDTPTGDQPLSMTVNGVMSKTVTLPVAP